MNDPNLPPETESHAVTEEQLEAINQFSRRALTADEVFVFSVILCDNEIDRDFERFPLESLHALGELFPGMTGVFDHSPKAENQSARIFQTAVELPGGVNSIGEEYAVLRAWAYMARCDKNADLIFEIDAGIKKEVSVGCAVEQILCSICGADQKTGGCSHQKDEVYDGQLCHHLLVGPTDAYEWSFVAVPAQKNAGVVKRYAPRTGEEAELVSKAHLERLEQLARFGSRYEDSLRKDVVRLGLLGQAGLSGEILESIAARLEIPQLEALRKSFHAAAEKRFPLPQLHRRSDRHDEEGDESFRI